jgi:hypothetical protein
MKMIAVGKPNLNAVKELAEAPVRVSLKIIQTLLG